MKTTFELVCPFCHTAHYVTVNMDDFWRWQDGELAQNAFPYLTATEREQLISQLCPKCQDSIFGGEDEEEWEDYEPDDIDDDCGFDPYCGCYTDDC